jgi:hypothetical protein
MCDVRTATIGYLFVFVVFVTLVEILLRSDIVINGIENYDSLSLYLSTVKLTAGPRGREQSFHRVHNLTYYRSLERSS